VDAAGGYLVQLLPGLQDDEIAEIEARLASLPHPTRLVQEGTPPEGVLERVFPDGWELLDRYPVAFRCPCSRERFESAIVSLGEAEIRRIIDEEENEATEVVCHFCNQAYHYTAADMAAILDAAR
jgi:molecular chaperone Hsp33